MSDPYRYTDEVVRERLAALRDQREAIIARRSDLEVEQREVELEIATTAKVLDHEPRGWPRLCRVVATLLGIGVVAVSS